MNEQNKLKIPIGKDVINGIDICLFTIDTDKVLMNISYDNGGGDSGSVDVELVVDDELFYCQSENSPKIIMSMKMLDFKKFIENENWTSLFFDTNNMSVNYIQDDGSYTISQREIDDSIFYFLSKFNLIHYHDITLMLGNHWKKIVSDYSTIREYFKGEYGGGGSEHSIVDKCKTIHNGWWSDFFKNS